MAGLFSRLKIWNPSETLSNTDLNAEFDHFLANIDAEHAEGYSQNLSNMQSTEDPGGVGSENLTQPISTAQEIQRLRYKIDEIIGGAQWYSTPATSIANIANSISTNVGLPGNRLIGCLSNADGQPIALQPDTGNSVVLKATVNDPVVVSINGTEYTFTADITLGGLIVAPNTNNTCLHASVASGGDDSRAFGQSYVYNNVSGDSILNGSGAIAIGTTGANITATAGTVQSFKLAAGGGDEYFSAFVEDASNLYRLKRGFFFDNTGALIEAQPIVTGETITLMRTGYIFLSTGGALSVTYNAPFVQDSTPVGFVVGDYWFDYSEDKWKFYNGSSWVDADALFIGIVVLDDTQSVCSRTTDIYKVFNDVNTLELQSVQNSGSFARAIEIGGSLSVYGNLINLPNDLITWDLTSDVASGETAAAGTWYCYVTQYGDRKISKVPPNFRPELKGMYHPGRPWRSIGWFVATGASTVNTNILSSGSFRVAPRNDQTRSLRIQESIRRDFFVDSATYGQVVVSNSSGAFSTSAGSYVDVTNLEVSLDTTGDHPVAICLIHDLTNTANTGTFGGAVGADGYTALLRLQKNGGTIATHNLSVASNGSGAASTSIGIPCSSFFWIDTAPSVGATTYKIQISSAAGGAASLTYTKLVVFEIW